MTDSAEDHYAMRNFSTVFVLISLHMNRKNMQINVLTIVLYSAIIRSNRVGDSEFRKC